MWDRGQNVRWQGAPIRPRYDNLTFSFSKWCRWTNTFTVFCCQIGPWWTYRLNFAEKWTRVFAETPTQQLQLKCCPRSFVQLQTEQVTFCRLLCMVAYMQKWLVSTLYTHIGSIDYPEHTVDTFNWELSWGHPLGTSDTSSVIEAHHEKTQGLKQ